MARYTGPRSKIARRFGYPLLGLSKALKNKPYPPGQHGKRPKSKSVYKFQLFEKQKAKYTYGASEKYLRNLYAKAAIKKGVTGHVLLQMLECRLDTFVYRCGLAPTQAAARQLVNHGHIEVNEKRCNIPSFQVVVGNVVSVRKKSKELVPIKESLTRANKKYEWIAFDEKELKGKLLHLPEREAIPEKIDEQKIVELYSK